MVNGFQILVAIFGDGDDLGLLIDEYLNVLCINYHLIPNFYCNSHFSHIHTTIMYYMNNTNSFLHVNQLSTVFIIKMRY